MRRRTTGPEIERLIQALAKLPGLGPRSARRAALFLIKNREKLLVPLSTALSEARVRRAIEDAGAILVAAEDDDATGLHVPSRRYLATRSDS